MDKCVTSFISIKRIFFHNIFSQLILVDFIEFIIKIINHNTSKAIIKIY